LNVTDDIRDGFNKIISRYKGEKDEGKKTCYCSRQAVYGRKCFVEIRGCNGGIPSDDEMFPL